MKGTIIKGIAGFYYVESGDNIYQCKARGLFKKQGLTPAVGDDVEFSMREDGDGFIEELASRKNSFIRPPVANVDMFIITAAPSDPEPDLFTLDKLMVTAEKSCTEIVLCINKVDMGSAEDIGRLEDVYGSVYPVLRTSVVTGQGIDELARIISGRRAAFAGQSGVGKSTLLNALIPDARSITGTVSSKSGRGRHTTRHVEIFRLPAGGYVYDTPGFTSFDIAGIEEAELQFMYPEFAPYIGTCRYDDCRHMQEPLCSIRHAVEEGHIHKHRYESYKAQLQFIKENRKY